MALTELYSGTEAVGATEWSLTTDSSSLAAKTDQGLMQVFLDLSAVTLADLFRLRVYEKVQAAGTQRVLVDLMLPPGHTRPQFVLPAIMLKHGWEVTLQKVAGTDRTITWSIRQVPGIITALYEGSASISTTEYSLTTNSTSLAAKTDDGVFQLFLDLNAVVLGDEYLLKVYEKVRSADSQRLVDQVPFVGKPGTPHWQSPSLILLHGWEMSMDKIAGTDRTVGWSVRQVA